MWFLHIILSFHYWPITPCQWPSRPSSRLTDLPPQTGIGQTKNNLHRIKIASKYLSFSALGLTALRSQCCARRAGQFLPRPTRRTTSTLRDPGIRLLVRWGESFGYLAPADVGMCVPAWVCRNLAQRPVVQPASAQQDWFILIGGALR